MAKKKVLLIFGGRSAEHEISVLSAGMVYNAIDKELYELILVGITRKGDWFLFSPDIFSQNDELFSLSPTDERVVLMSDDGRPNVTIFGEHVSHIPVDVALPILHGPYGEDGTIQGLFKMANLPFVGPGVLSSSVAMDKEVMKRLMEHGEVPVVPYQVLRAGDTRGELESCFHELGPVLFVKPSNMGSSVGVSRVESVDELANAIEYAFRFDNKVLIEKGVEGKEVEVGVLGNNQRREVSVVGQVIPSEEHGFYSYDSKYIDESGALLLIPAPLSEAEAERVKELALKATALLEIEGMARVDSFVQEDGRVLINEINTIPGFTPISMYPSLWEAWGKPYTELLDDLLQLALARHERDSLLSCEGG